LDDEQKYKFKVEVENRANKLWEDFLAGMDELDFVGHTPCQQLDFRNTRYLKSDMRGRLVLKVPPKDDGKL